MVLLRPAWRDGRLTPAARDVFGGVARGMLDGSLPREPAPAADAIASLLGRIEALVDALPPHAQAELSQLLALLASGPGRLALAGLHTPWFEAGVGEVQASLQSMRLSGVELRRQAYQALHDITAGAYFSDPSAWGLLGYPGPREIAA